MRKSYFTTAQIIGMIKEPETGMPTAGVCRRHGLSPATIRLPLHGGLIIVSMTRVCPLLTRVILMQGRFSRARRSFRAMK